MSIASCSGLWAAISSAAALEAMISAPPTSSLPLQWSGLACVLTSLSNRRAASGSASRMAASMVPGEPEVEERVHQQTLFAVHDETGIAPAPAAIGLDPGIASRSDLVQAVREGANAKCHGLTYNHGRIRCDSARVQRLQEAAVSGPRRAYTLGRTLGDVRGARVLDLACGDGFYTRLLKQAGAASATGVDLSSEMIRLAEESERRRPLGCSYVQADATKYRPGEPVDLVVAAYLLNYARTRTELVRLCRAARDSLRPGDSIGFTNYHHSRGTYEAAFRKAGFADFRWVPVALDPSQAGNTFWDDFMRSPPIIGFSAER